MSSAPFEKSYALRFRPAGAVLLVKRSPLIRARISRASSASRAFAGVQGPSPAASAEHARAIVRLAPCLRASTGVFVLTPSAFAAWRPLVPIASSHAAQSAALITLSRAFAIDQRSIRQTKMALMRAPDIANLRQTAREANPCELASSKAKIMQKRKILLTHPAKGFRYRITTANRRHHTSPVPREPGFCISGSPIGAVPRDWGFTWSRGNAGRRRAKQARMSRPVTVPHRPVSRQPGQSSPDYRIGASIR